MRHPGEPSVEEILESIKRVIAREDRGERLARRPAALERFAEGEPDEPEPQLKREPQLESDDDVLDLAQLRTVRDRPDDAGAGPPLVTEGTSTSMRGSLAALAAAAEPAQPATDRSGADRGLEPLVRELLRPALADWLDRNLPAIVERMVAAEIARIAGRPG